MYSSVGAAGSAQLGGEDGPKAVDSPGGADHSDHHTALLELRHTGEVLIQGRQIMLGRNSVHSIIILYCTLNNLPYRDLISYYIILNRIRGRTQNKDWAPSFLYASKPRWNARKQ